MAYLSLGLLLLQTVAAAPSLLTRDDSLCPNGNGTVITNGGKSWSIECGLDAWGGDLPQPNGQSFTAFGDCIAACADRQGCQSVAWLRKNACYLKGSIPARRVKPDVLGAVLASADASATVHTSTSTILQTQTVIVTQSPAANALVVASASATPSGSSVPLAVSNAVSNTDGSCGSRPVAKKLSTKRGVAYNDISKVTPFAGKISWVYNWGQTAGGALPTGVEFVSMLWGQKMVNGWTANAQAAVDSGATALLGFNEPDHNEQALMTPDAAASLWKAQMEPFACKARLGAPAVTNGGAPMGLDWLTKFLTSCSTCTIDYVPIHWYDSAANVDYFKSYVQQAYTAAGQRPLWLTEFGATGDDATVDNFFQIVLPWLDSQPYVERYSYYWAAEGSLNSGNSLSAMGQSYVKYGA